MMALAVVAMAECLAVGAGSDHVTAADLAPAFPAMASLPPDTAIALAPAPGVVRTFRVPEMRSLATRFHLSDTPQSEICVTRPVSPLDPARMLEAMRTSYPNARIEILEISRQPAPAGEMAFPAIGLRRLQDNALWTGYVRYGENRRFTIWAKVRVRIEVTRVVATVDIQPGRPIAASEISEVQNEDFPRREPFAGHADDVIGKSSRAVIRAGTALRLDHLTRASDVTRGETVQVEVRDGAATLNLDAKAETSGAVGDEITVENPASHKRFRARVAGKGRVEVNRP